MERTKIHFYCYPVLSQSPRLPLQKYFLLHFNLRSDFSEFSLYMDVVRSLVVQPRSIPCSGNWFIHSCPCLLTVVHWSTRIVWKSKWARSLKKILSSEIKIGNRDLYQYKKCQGIISVSFQLAIREYCYVTLVLRGGKKTLRLLFRLILFCHFYLC